MAHYYNWMKTHREPISDAVERIQVLPTGQSMHVTGHTERGLRAVSMGVTHSS